MCRLEHVAAEGYVTKPSYLSDAKGKGGVIVMLSTLLASSPHSSNGRYRPVHVDCLTTQPVTCSSEMRFFLSIVSLVRVVMLIDFMRHSSVE
jgi:hypothetical protein